MEQLDAILPHLAQLKSFAVDLNIQRWKSVLDFPLDQLIQLSVKIKSEYGRS